MYRVVGLTLRSGESVQGLSAWLSDRCAKVHRTVGATLGRDFPSFSGFIDGEGQVKGHFTPGIEITMPLSGHQGISSQV